MATRGVAPKQQGGLRRAFSPAFRAGESGAAKFWFIGFGGAMLLDRLGPPGRCSGCRPHDGKVAGGAVADLGLLISGPRLNLNYHPFARARARLARPGSAGCYGVARQREGSRQNRIGGCGVLSLRHFGLVLLIRWRVGAEGIWRGEDRFRPARCCSTGSGRLGGAGRTMERSLAAPSPI